MVVISSQNIDAMSLDKKDIEVFQDSFRNIFGGLIALKELGVDPRDTISFIKKINEKKVIFSSNFYFDSNKKNFVFETNFPDNFEYYKELIPMIEQMNLNYQLSKEEN